MTTSTATIPASIATPAEATTCPKCERFVDEGEGFWVPVTGVRYEGDTNTYAHCPECGRTDLLDTRSPFEALADARRLLAEATDVHVSMVRFDLVEAIERVTATADPAHCADCRRFAPLAAR